MTKSHSLLHFGMRRIRFHPQSNAIGAIHVNSPTVVDHVRYASDSGRWRTLRHPARQRKTERRCGGRRHCNHSKLVRRIPQPVQVEHFRGVTSARHADWNRSYGTTSDCSRPGAAAVANDLEFAVPWPPLWLLIPDLAAKCAVTPRIEVLVILPDEGVARIPKLLE